MAQLVFNLLKIFLKKELEKTEYFKLILHTNYLESADFYKQLPVVSTDDKYKYTMDEQKKQVDPANVKATLRILDEEVEKLTKKGDLFTSHNVMFYLHSGVSYWRIVNEVKTGKFKHLAKASWRYFGRLAPSNWCRTLFDNKTTGYTVFVFLA